MHVWDAYTKRRIGAYMVKIAQSKSCRVRENQLLQHFDVRPCVCHINRILTLDPNYRFFGSHSIATWWAKFSNGAQTSTGYQIFTNIEGFFLIFK